MRSHPLAFPTGTLSRWAPSGLVLVLGLRIFCDVCFRSGSNVALAASVGGILAFLMLVSAIPAKASHTLAMEGE